jgi:hypothetical protein
MTDVWVFKNGERVIFRGPLAECADAWQSAEGSDKWHGSISYESGDLSYDQQADKLLGVADFMEHPGAGWREPIDFEPMREEMRKLGRAAAASLDAMMVEAFRKTPP